MLVSVRCVLRGYLSAPRVSPLSPQTQSLTSERDRANKRVAELEGLVQQYQADQEALEKKLREQISATEAAKRQTETVERELKGA